MGDETTFTLRPQWERMMEGRSSEGTQQEPSSWVTSQMWSRPPLRPHQGMAPSSHRLASSIMRAVCITRGPAIHQPIHIQAAGYGHASSIRWGEVSLGGK